MGEVIIVLWFLGVVFLSHLTIPEGFGEQTKHVTLKQSLMAMAWSST